VKTQARAVARLVSATLHVARGVWITRRRFPQLSAAQRVVEVQRWALRLLVLLGVRLDAQGQAAGSPCLLVANHISWLDILAIHAVCPQARFVAKSDLKHWPVIGRLTEAAGTLFIERERKRDAMRVVHHMAEALRRGDTVAVFPEGTTSDGHDVLPFHANLLQAAIATGTPLQPLALRYSDARHAVSPAAAYVGDTSLLRSLWWVAMAQGLTARVQRLPLQPAGETDRRALAQTLRSLIHDARRLR
jgi:1-acyl-sn-glycerol-3-phosphate acyltransferase